MILILFIIFIAFFPVNLFALDAQFRCENKLTDKLLYRMTFHEKKLCEKYPENRINNLSNCERYKLKLRKIKVCKLLQNNGLIKWSHQAFIDVPNFKEKKGIAYIYFIPCWEYGTNTSVRKTTYMVNNNIMTIGKKIDESKFNINFETLRAGYREKRNYVCILDIYQKK